MVTTFIGVDLAWQTDKNHSGIAVLHGNTNGATLFPLPTGTVFTLLDVVDRVVNNSTDNTVVAIDAPLIIKNTAGQRPCENLIGKKFARYHAAAYPANLTRYPNSGSVEVARTLEQKGFSHTPNPASDQYKGGRWFFEVYPHAAQIVLFHLDKIIKYKKGRVEDKRAGLEILRHNIRTKFMQGKPPLHYNEPLEELLTRNLAELRGRMLKDYEDILDALVCAYLAFFYWRWGGEKNELIGNLETGYIINPTEAL